MGVSVGRQVGRSLGRWVVVLFVHFMLVFSNAARQCFVHV